MRTRSNIRCSTLLAPHHCSILVLVVQFWHWGGPLKKKLYFFSLILSVLRVISINIGGLERQIFCCNAFVNFQLKLKHMFSMYPMLFFSLMRWITKTLHPPAPGPALLLNFRTLLWPASQKVCPSLINNIIILLIITTT